MFVLTLLSFVHVLYRPVYCFVFRVYITTNVGIEWDFENRLSNDQIETVSGYTAPVFKILSLASSAVSETNNVSVYKLFFNKFSFNSRFLANVILSDVYIY